MAYGIGPDDVKFADVNATSGTADNTLVAAVAGKKIRVLGYTVAGSAAAEYLIKSATTTIGRLNLLSTAPQVYPGTIESPAFETARGEALIINLPGAQTIKGHLTYVLV